MTRSAVEVFGVIRFADEHELEPHVIAVRARLSKGQVSAAVAICVLWACWCGVVRMAGWCSGWRGLGLRCVRLGRVSRGR